MIKEFELTGVGLTGFIMEENKFIGLVSGGMDLSNQNQKLNCHTMQPLTRTHRLHKTSTIRLLIL